MVDESSSSNSFSKALDLTYEGSIVSDVQLVKGLTFETARRYFSERFGVERWTALVAALPAETRELIRTVDGNAWYPESELRRVIHLVHRDLAERNEALFLELARGLALAGISRFFRVIINLASARFVLRKVPVIWKRLRRGPATVASEVTAEGRVLVHYENYVYCHDPVYRLLSVANCQALVVAAVGVVPVTEVLVHDRVSMTLAFTLPEKPPAPS